jgi:hypothetical protein
MRFPMTMTEAERALCKELAACGEGRDDLKGIMARYSELAFGGYRTRYEYPTSERFEQGRADLLHSLEDFHIVRAFLRPVPKWDKFNRRFTSYTWKHHVEAWAGTYISNGAFIAGALSLGFRIDRADNTPNAFLSIEAKYGKPGMLLPLHAQEAACSDLGQGRRR